MDKSANSERTEPRGSSLRSGPMKPLPQTPPLPVKVLIVIISLILYMFVPALVLLSCNFISVMQQCCTVMLISEMIGILMCCGYSSSHNRSHFFHAPLSMSMDGHLCKHRHISYPVYLPGWTTSALYRSIISPLLWSANHVPPFCLWTTPYQFSFLVDDDDKVSMLPTTPLSTTPTCTCSHHAKWALSISHASAIAAPTCSNADSGCLHIYRCQSALKSYHILQGVLHTVDTLFPSFTHTADALLPILLFSKADHILLTSSYYHILQSVPLSLFPPWWIMDLVCLNIGELKIEGKAGEEY